MSAPALHARPAARALLLAGIVLLAGAAAFQLLGGPPSRKGAPAGGDATSGVDGRRGGIPRPGSPEEEGPTGDALGPVVERSEPTTTHEAALPETLTAALAEGAIAHMQGAGEAEAAIADARSGKIDPLAMGVRLDQAARDSAGAGSVILDALLAETDPARALRLAISLAGALDDEALRKATCEGLKAAAPDVRAIGLIALRGRTDPEVTRLAIDGYCADAPEARAAAGFLLNVRPEPLSQPDAMRVRDAARAALAGGDASPRLREESLGILGRPGAAEEDLGRIERAVLGGGDLSVRSRALAALVATEAAGPRLRPTLERLIADPGAPPELKKVAEMYLATR